MPSATCFGSSPARVADAMAASALETLNSPGSRTAARTSTPGPWTVNVAPVGDSSTSVARQSASAPCVEYVDIGIVATSSSRRPNSSSTLVRPMAARSGVKRLALAAK